MLSKPCTILDCGAPTPPKNGNVSGTNYLEDDIVTYSCRMGFAITGNVTSTCQNDGNWSNANVTCRAGIHIFYVHTCMDVYYLRAIWGVSFAQISAHI